MLPEVSLERNIKVVLPVGRLYTWDEDDDGLAVAQRVEKFSRAVADLLKPWTATGTIIVDEGADTIEPLVFIDPPSMALVQEIKDDVLELWQRVTQGRYF